MQIETVPEAPKAPATSGSMTKLALLIIAVGLLANLAYNALMSKLGYEYPYDSFLFRRNDTWGDFFKLVFSYTGDPIHPPSLHWGIQPLIDFLRQQADGYRGTSINPDHLPPLPTLLAVLVRRAFSAFDPMLVFVTCTATLLLSYATTLAGFARQREARLMWIMAGVLTYPLWFAINRGQFFSVLCAITLMSATRRMIESRAMSWQSILLLALSCNFRPNVVIVPVVLVLGLRTGRFRDLIWLGLTGAAVLGLAMLAAHALYPHYGLATWMAGMNDYNTNYVKQPLTLGFVTSLPSLLNQMLGFSQGWTLLGLGLAAIMGALTVLAARAKLLSPGQVVFLALGLMVVAIPGFTDYHLIPYLLPVMLIAAQTGEVSRGDWVAYLASAALLIPKNYAWETDDFWRAWSYQIVFNPVIAVGAMVTILALAVRARPGAIVGEIRNLATISRLH